MGMSASQARLLSITSRLTNNEFRAQTITNSKLRLAEKSEEASAEYMDALNSQQLVFGVYSSENGEYSTQKLTPALIYDYAPLKNQYALVNPAGKILVSAQDAKNFETTNSLSEFLKSYGLLESVTVTEKHEVNNPDYADAMKKYQDDYDKWLDDKPKREDFEAQSSSSELYDNYMSMIETSACYNITVNSGKRCYMHLLGALIGIGNHTTSDGNTFEIVGPGGGWNWNVSEYGTVDETSSKVNEKIKEKEALADGPFAGKSVYQAVVDFMWESKDLYSTTDTSSGGVATQEELDTFWYIVNTELKEAMSEFDEEGYNEAMRIWREQEPQKPTIPSTIIENVTIEHIKLNDKDKSQWYTNLWYMMNGSDTVNKIKEKEIYDDEKNETYNVFVVDSASKSGKGGTYEVFEDMNLFKSSDWLQFALEHGMVSMYQAQYDNPAADSGKVPELTSEGITWKSIIYTNASDIRSQEDEVKIAIAEVKYKNAVREIENKDKKFDQDLKKLDTEHTALQTEYDSIKEVISKNVERSFKAFS